MNRFPLVYDVKYTSFVFLPFLCVLWSLWTMKNHLLTAAELDKRSVAVGLKLIFVKSENKLTATQCNVTSFIVIRLPIGLFWAQLYISFLLKKRTITFLFVQTFSYKNFDFFSHIFLEELLLTDFSARKAFSLVSAVWYTHYV